ncbi:MAG: nickel pincer cofactor biosynthesis protein LarB [Magnetococcales bacterium]|nr:nickel pincer cofactor biosynthesis protein LarB [Magnetococcales bacterium]
MTQATPPQHPLREVLEAVARGEITVEAALARLSPPPFDPVTVDHQVVARLDRQRKERQGFPEVIFARGKKTAHLEQSIAQALTHGDDLLVTRVDRKRGNKLAGRFAGEGLVHHRASRCLYRQAASSPPDEGHVVVFSAGTSDIPVAEEAALTARMLGARVTTYYDAGVAGLHRLLAAEALLKSGRVYIVVAGMEGAMPSVVGGLVSKPVIAVPTSIGYGASFHGLAALLGMLNSCAANVTVVNIDNGFGAGYVAGLINRLGDPSRQAST